MTVETVKSTIVSNLGTAGNAETLMAPTQAGHASEYIDSYSVATTSLDDDGDKILMLPLPSNIRLSSLKIYNDDLDSGTALTFDVGIANGPDQFVDNGTTYAAYAAINEELFADDFADQSAITTGTELVIANAVSHVDEMDQALWKRLGLAADPQKIFVVQVMVDTPAQTPAAGRLVLVARGITGA